MSILALGRRHKKKRKFPIQEREKTQNRKKIPNERVGERKKKERKKNSRSRIGRKQTIQITTVATNDVQIVKVHSMSLDIVL